MAYESTEEPGRKFQNIQHGKTFDRVRKEEKSSKKSKPSKHEEPDGDEEQPIHEVVSQHGPADKTEIEKEGDAYTVHSHHGGHKHTSHGHGSLHEAHSHSMMAHGEPGGMEGEEPAEAEAMPMAGGPGAAPPGM
jgi:hypothetical protein